MKAKNLITAALLLSMAGSGLAAMLFFMAAVFFEAVQKLVGDWTDILTAQRISPVYFVLLGAVCTVSLAGVIKMWRKQPAGYYFYTGAQLCLLVIPPLWMGGNAFSPANAIFTGIFVSIYTFFFSKVKPPVV